MTATRTALRRVSGIEVTILEADITSLDRVDAIVSADDSLLTHGGGVSRALWRAGSPILEEWWQGQSDELHVGDITVSPAGSLRADWLVHAVTIDFHANEAIRVLGGREVVWARP